MNNGRRLDAGVNTKLDRYPPRRRTRPKKAQKGQIRATRAVSTGIAGRPAAASPSGQPVRPGRTTEDLVLVERPRRRVWKTVQQDEHVRHAQSSGEGYYRMGGQRYLTERVADWVPDPDSRSRRHYVNGWSDKV